MVLTTCHMVYRWLSRGEPDESDIVGCHRLRLAAA